MKLEKFEVQKFGPYRFIGKSVYARAGMACGQGNFAGYIWENSQWVFDKLDEMNEYAAGETHKAALLTWEWYNSAEKKHYDMVCGGSRLLGYTVGKFMKADAPVPDGMDYFDIPDTFAAKGWFDEADDGSQERMVKNALEQQGNYTDASWKFMAEVGGGFGYYIACVKKN